MDDLQTVVTEREELNDPAELEAMDLDDADEALAVKAVRFLRLLWSHRKMVRTIVLTGIVLSVACAFILKKTYTSRTSLMPPGGSSSYSSMLSLLASPTGGMASDALGLDSPGELYVKILQSRNVEDGLIHRFDLMHYFQAKVIDDARKSLEGESTIDQDVKSGVITITVSDTSPTMAANMANGYAAELNRVLTEGSTSSARRERIFLEGRLKEIKKDLDDSSLALSQFSTKSKTLDIDSQAKSMVDQGAKLEADLIESRSEMAALQQTLSPDNPRYKAAEARINELQRQMNAVGGFSGKGKGSNSILPSAAELPKLGLTYYNLERKVKVDEDLWEALTKQYEAAKVSEVKEIPTVSILDVGKVPEKKSGPVRRMILMVGTLLSIILACLAVVGLEKWNATEDENEVKKLLLDVGAFVRIFGKMKKAKKEETVVG